MIYPDHTALLVPRVMGPRIYGEFVHRLRRISGSTLMQARLPCMTSTARQARS